MLKCDCCNMTSFDTKQAYNRHIQSKKHKKAESGQIMNMIQCKMCNKWYSSKSALSHHKKVCPKIVSNDETRNQIHSLKCIIEEQRIRHEKERDEMKAQIALLLERNAMISNDHNHTTHNTTNNNDNSTNTTNNIETQNVIIVNSFGNENTEYLTDRIVSKLIKDGPFTCLPKIIERIHFNPEHPENHNIKVTNQKNNYAKIIQDNKWVTTNKKQAIEKMIQNGYDILEEKYQDNKESMNDFKKERFENFQYKYENNDKELMRTMRDGVDIALINGTDKIHR